MGGDGVAAKKEKTAPKRNEKGQFIKGASGNPSGRPARPPEMLKYAKEAPEKLKAIAEDESTHIKVRAEIERWFFESVYGNNDYILENEGTLCAWHNEYNEKSKLCKFYLSLFCENEDGSYDRFDEVQTEKCYSMKHLTSALSKNGFELLSVYGDLDKSAATPQSEKWYFVARCIK